MKFVKDIVEENGKTIEENNLARQHSIPLGALVEVNKTGIRLFVGYQGRDCGGDLLYWLQPEKENLGIVTDDFWVGIRLKRIGGYSEESLTVIKES